MPTLDMTSPNQAYFACPDCDLLLNLTIPEHGTKGRCPRCDRLLQRPRRHSIERTLVLSLTGLILMLPANLLPMVGIRIFGNSQDGSLWSGVSALFNEGMWLVAVLVLMSSVLVPLLNLGLAMLISLHLHFKRVHTHLADWLSLLQHLNEWAMLEVYALGIIVACVKLSSMADLRFGMGLYAFVCLIAINAFLAHEIDYALFWRRIAELTGGAPPN